MEEDIKVLEEFIKRFNIAMKKYTLYELPINEAQGKDLIPAMENLIKRNKDNVVGVTNEKAVGIIYIDDRGYRYKGLLDLIDNLKEILKGDK